MSKTLTLKTPRIDYADMTEARLQREREQAVRDARRAAQKVRSYVDGKFLSPPAAKTNIRF